MAGETIPAELWPHDGPAPKVEQVLSQVAGLLKDLGYTKTSSALEKEALKKTSLTKLDPASGLLALYSSSTAVTTTSDDSDADSESSDSESDDDSEDESEKDEVEAALVDVEAEETSDDSSDEESSDSEPAAVIKPVEKSTKRKRAATPSSSGDSSSDDDSSSSDESDARPAKKTKVAETKAGASDSDSSSSDSSSDDSSSSDSDSSESAADDSSSSDSSSSSDDSSSSESESEEEPAPPPVKVKKEKKEKKEKAAKTPLGAIIQENYPKETGSQSSATLQGDSPEVEEEADVEMSGIHPDRLKQSQFAPTTRKEVAANGKKSVVPFSRIPADQKIDPRFSNEYVSYDYADKAYQDLVVTKGKGFTKEKNKKKRGESYPVSQRRGIANELLQVHTEAVLSIWHQRASSLTISESFSLETSALLLDILTFVACTL